MSSKISAILKENPRREKNVCPGIVCQCCTEIKREKEREKESTCPRDFLGTLSSGFLWNILYMIEKVTGDTVIHFTTVQQRCTSGSSGTAT